MAYVLPCGHHVAHQHQPHYCEYLQLGELLQIQPSAERLRHPDEYLFVTTHQSIELWFKQILFEIQRCIDALDADNIGLGIWLARRLNRISSLLISTLQLMDTMAPSDFFTFRTHLSPASGAESQQFREIELLAGIRDPAYRRQLETSSPEGACEHGTRLWTERLSQLWESRSLRVALLDTLQRRGITPEMVYVVAPQPNPYADLFLLIEELLDFDETMALWRATHVRIVERAIGPMLSGTGNSSGVRHLNVTANTRRFFPELWQVRTRLWEWQTKGTTTPERTHGCPMAAVTSGGDESTQ